MEDHYTTPQRQMDVPQKLLENLLHGIKKNLKKDKKNEIEIYVKVVKT